MYCERDPSPPNVGGAAPPPPHVGRYGTSPTLPDAPPAPSSAMACSRTASRSPCTHRSRFSARCSCERAGSVGTPPPSSPHRYHAPHQSCGTCSVAIVLGPLGCQLPGQDLNKAHADLKQLAPTCTEVRDRKMTLVSFSVLFIRSCPVVAPSTVNQPVASSGHNWRAENNGTVSLQVAIALPWQY